MGANQISPTQAKAERESRLNKTTWPVAHVANRKRIPLVNQGQYIQKISTIGEDSLQGDNKT